MSGHFIAKLVVHPDITFVEVEKAGKKKERKRNVYVLNILP